MNIKKISEKNAVVRLLVKGTNTTFMNAIRRAIMADVPTLAIEDVAIYQNDSVMFDEFLAHRLALLPINTDLKTYKKKEKVKFVLEKEGPAMVYSKDLKCTDPKIEIARKKIPIVKLKKDQKVKLEATAVMISGKEHAKWQPAIVSYNELPIIANEKECDLCKECIKACPKEVLEVKAKKIILKDPFECTLCGECRDRCPKDALRLEYDSTTFILTIEPTQALSTKEVLNAAVEALKEKAQLFKKEMTKL